MLPTLMHRAAYTRHERPPRHIILTNGPTSFYHRNTELLARKQSVPILTPLVWRSRCSYPQPPDYEANVLSTPPPSRCRHKYNTQSHYTDTATSMFIFGERCSTFEQRRCVLTRGRNERLYCVENGEYMR